MDDDVRKMLEDKDYATITGYYPLPKPPIAYRIGWYTAMTFAAIMLVVCFVVR